MALRSAETGGYRTAARFELYTDKAGAQNGIRSVRENGGDAERFEKTTTSSGAYRFNLTAKG